jgi:hypothetical protein
MNRPALVALMAGAVIASPRWASPQPEAQDRATLGRELLARWSARLEDGGAELRGALEELPLETLAAMAGAESKADLARAMFGEPGPLAFGDADTDLVYFPLAPCRLADTRSFSTGPTPLGDGASAPFSVNNLLEAQGGNPAGCGVPQADPGAVAVTVTAVNSAGPGHLRLYPVGTTPDVASAVVNHGLAGSGLNLANTTVVALTRGPEPYEFMVQGNGNAAHVVIDVVGYFRRPTATALVCQTVSRQRAVAASATVGFGSPACPNNTTLTGGGLDTYLQNIELRAQPLRSLPNASGTGWACLVHNPTNRSWISTCRARCCQTAGR